MTRTGVLRARYAHEVEPRPPLFTDPLAYRAWADRADAWGRGRAPRGAAAIIAGPSGESFEITPTPATAERASFDARANRALRGTVTGESMAGWGPRYIREARAIMALSGQGGRLWEKVAE